MASVHGAIAGAADTRRRKRGREMATQTPSELARMSGRHKKKMMKRPAKRGGRYRSM